MHLLEKFDQLSASSISEPGEKVLSHKLTDELKQLSHFKTMRELKRSKLYTSLRNDFNALTYGYEYGCYADPNQKFSKPYCRAILWHLENGVNFSGILETLRNRAMVSQADIYFFPAADIGRARSHNRNVVRDLAIELGYNYYFAASYLNLPEEKQAEESDSLGFEGNAIMTRLPLSDLRVIPLKREPDGYAFGVKRLGCEKAVVADLNFDGKKFTAVCLNLPSWSSSRQRARYMKQVLSKIAKTKEKRPILVGGDLKTSNYNSSSPIKFVLSLINKVYRDFDYIIEEHHAFPEKHFEHRVFDVLRHYRFDYEAVNELGKGTFHSSPEALLQSANKPAWVDRLMTKFLTRYRDRLPFKYDWFCASELIRVSSSHQAERPKVISHLFQDGKPVSSHDPILLDFEIQEAKASVDGKKK